MKAASGSPVFHTGRRSAVAGALVFVLQRPKCHGHALVSLPLGLLRLIAAVPLRVVLRGRQTPVDLYLLEGRRRLVRALPRVALVQQLLREKKRVYEGLVSGKVLKRSEQVVTSQMDVLVVDDNDRPQAFLHGSP